MLGNIVVVGVVFAILVFIHELGHLLACKIAGVKVEKFSLGFGPALLKWKSAETTYMISAVPLGGYIKMEGEDFGATGFFAAPLGKKVLVMVLGPSANLLLGFVLMAVLYGVFGVRKPEPRVVPVPGSRAELAGFQKGDLVLRLNGDTIRSYVDLEPHLAGGGGPRMVFQIRRGDQSLSLTPDVSTESLGLNEFTRVGIMELVPDGPAAAAGMRPGDLILNVDTIPIEDREQFIRVIRETYPAKIKIGLLRDRDTIYKEIAARLTPDPTTGEELPRIGAGIDDAVATTRVRVSVAVGVWEGFKKTGQLVVVTFDVLYQLLIGRISARAVSGPVMVGKIVYQGVQSGAEMLLAIWALLSLNLFVINMLPVPFLDGGRAVLFIFEGIRRKKLTARQWDIALRIGLHMVVLLVILALSNDFLNIFHVPQGNLSKKLQLGMIAAYFIFAVVDIVRTPPAKPEEPKPPTDGTPPSTGPEEPT